MAGMQSDPKAWSFHFGERVPPLDPEWDKAERVHDWRNHVGERTKEVWQTLTLEQRRAVYLDAEEMSSREEWE